MLVGYVSDERYLALADVLFEFVSERGVVSARSSSSGSVYADIEAGSYIATLQKDGFGPKRIEFNAHPDLSLIHI